MSVIEIIQFTTHPATTTEALQQALELLERELEHIGGFPTRTLYREAGTETVGKAWRAVATGRC